MSRVREVGDWIRDREAALRIEAEVAARLQAHPLVTHFANYTDALDALDFEFRFESRRVRLDAKAKFGGYSAEVVGLWPEVPSADLLILDETCYRSLVWSEEMGYLLVRDEPAARWHCFGPWELCLGPHRRYERRENKGSGEFLKGKLLVDLRTAARTSETLEIDDLLDVVRDSRSALRQVEAVPIRSRPAVPVIPRVIPRVSPQQTGPAPRPSAVARDTAAAPRPSGVDRPAAAPRPSAVARDTAAAPRPSVAERPRADVRPPSAVPATAAAPQVDDAWAGLDPDLVAVIERRWGWRRPTAIQAKAIPLILTGANVLVLAPTAGGKTEAALLPLLDIHHQSGWRAPSILMISPLKALLDDQLSRYRKAAALTGATAFVWHGDTGSQKRNAFRDRPADLMLTTPESLENLLSRPSGDSRLLDHLQAVVIDEVHAFAGTPRGAQLAALLERIDQVANTDLQRIGLSATVGNPSEVLAWLHGGSQRRAEMAMAPQPMKGEELTLVTYETTTEAAILIGEAVAGKKALVFAPSRRRAEELANALGVPVHHSSVAADGRRAAIDRLATEPAGCLVATAGLELGIDLGDLEIAVNDGAPTDPSSYLQRIGRAGRRDGNRRMLLTVGDPDSLLLALAVVTRARRGRLDPVPPLRGARLVLGQQILALAFQRTALLRSDVYENLMWSPLFAPLRPDIDATVEHLLAGSWLAAVGEHLVVGAEGQARFGGRNFTELLATFDTQSGASVIGPDGARIGTLDWSQVTDDAGAMRSGGVNLAGRPWTAVGMDRQAGTVTVAPAGQGRMPSWRGPSIEVARATWETAREVLSATEVPITTDERAKRWLDELRASWAPRLATPARSDGEQTVVDAFGGVVVHRAMLATLGLEGSVDGPTCRIDASLPVAAAAARAALDRWTEVLDAETGRRGAVVAIRHRQLVAPQVLLAESRQFQVDGEGLRAALELLAGAS